MPTRLPVVVKDSPSPLDKPASSRAWHVPFYVLEFIEIPIERSNGNSFLGCACGEKRVGKPDIDGLQAFQRSAAERQPKGI